jgi:hypothetical protein
MKRSRLKPEPCEDAMRPSKPKALLYRDALADAERRIVEALPSIVDAIIAQATAGDLKAAVYLCDRIMGRTATLALPPAADQRQPFTEADFELEQEEREERLRLRRLFGGSGANDGA